MYYNCQISTYEENTLLYKVLTTCLLEDDFLSYHTDNDSIRINLQTFSLTKENLESVLRINKEKCTLKLKELNQSLEIPIDYINFENDNNKNITIAYKLASQEKTLKIKIELGSVNNEI